LIGLRRRLPFLVVLEGSGQPVPALAALGVVEPRSPVEVAADAVPTSPSRLSARGEQNRGGRGVRIVAQVVAHHARGSPRLAILKKDAHRFGHTRIGASVSDDCRGYLGSVVVGKRVAGVATDEPYRTRNQNCQ